MAIVRIKAFSRWLGLTMPIPHNGEVTRPQIPGAVFSCGDSQARYLIRECFATYCLPDGTPCDEAAALLQADPPKAVESISPPLPPVESESSIAEGGQKVVESGEPQEGNSAEKSLDTEQENADSSDLDRSSENSSSEKTTDKESEPDRHKKRKPIKTEGSRTAV